jgi:hypothetical protein
MLAAMHGDARVNVIPIAEERTAPWKEGWIETDTGALASPLIGFLQLP